ncbi:unnamed protein product [Chilo suppressalis]|uniref:DUF4371 domain-containing protein n=1 Tax=Chilo suppressalis TaxID=168631 RepID=A0ABN8AW36_CHISP|nr:unnamed protein product [Chilo suppressalis]
MPPKYSQHYREEWEQMREFKDWLSPVQDDATKAYCKYCKCNIIAKLYCLKQHISTTKHVKSVEPMKSQTKIKFAKIQTRLDTQNLAHFICEHAAILTVDHLSDMCKKTFSDSRSTENMKLHRTKCTNIINNVLAPHFVSELIKDVGDAKFSILIDESTDISVTKILMSRHVNSIL